jgi:hypothetical protein
LCALAFIMCSKSMWPLGILSSPLCKNVSDILEMLSFLGKTFQPYAILSVSVYEVQVPFG